MIDRAHGKEVIRLGSILPSLDLARGVAGNEGFEDSGVTLINGSGAWGQKQVVWLVVERLDAENVELGDESTATFKDKYLNLKLTALLG
ncbi:hypothetical protein CIB48_g9365 [Xylaria polymorpha]|nr:hypothetical protein CIB48_g9365 [Xylaria polymorpha]